VYNALGQQQHALEYYEQALAILREVRDRSGEGTTLNNLGGVYDDLGQKQHALEYYEQALAIRREVRDRSGEGTTLNNLGHVYNALGQKQHALEYYEQALAIRREVRDRSGEGTTLHNIGMIYAKFGQFDVALACVLLAKTLYEYVQSPSDVDDEVQWIAALRTHLGEQPFASLLARIEHRPDEIVETALQNNRLPDETEQPLSTMPPATIAAIIDRTVAVLTALPQHRAMWRETLREALADAQQRGTNWRIEVDFFTALLAILDGHLLSLPTDHPYAAPIVAIQERIARDEPTPDGEGDGPERLRQAKPLSHETPETTE
jgi:tetratricopeptide (TPR) repeat protein